MTRGAASEHGQKAHGKTYTGDYNTHSSHVFGVGLMDEYGLSDATRVALNESGNYHNSNAYTNQSVHNRIDNAIRSGDYDSGSVSGASGSASYIPPQEQADRLHSIFSVAQSGYAETGDPNLLDAMHDIRGIAGNELNCDLRQYRMPKH